MIVKHEKDPDIREDGSELVNYDNQDFKIFSRRNYIIANQTFLMMVMHWHTDIEIIYIRKGSVSYQLNGRKVVMKKGEGIIVNSRQMHCIQTENEDCILDCLIFHPLVLCATRYVENNFVLPIINNDYLPYIMLSDRIEWQKRILHLTSEIFEWSENENCEMEQLSTLTMLWKILYDNLDINTEEVVDNNLEIVKKMIEYIHAEYAEQIKLEDICRQGGVGRTHCAKLFDKYTNMTPMEFLKNHRLSKAVELLLDTDMSVSDISYEVGFSGPAYFTKSFREKMGCSPLDYKKEILSRKI